MKNNNKEKLRKTKITIGTIGLASSVAFGIAAPLVINANSHKNSYVAHANWSETTTPPDANSIGIIQRKASESPKYIYSWAPVNTTQLSSMVLADVTKYNAYLANFLRAYMSYNLGQNNEIKDKLIESISSIYMHSNNQYIGNIFDDKGNQGRKIFTDRQVIFDNYNKLNGLGQTLQTTEKMSIIKPSEIRDIASAKYGASAAPIVNGQTLLNTDGFAYKVAEIDLDKLKDQKSLAFSFKDNSDQDASNHDYKIIISNENGELSNFLSGTTLNIKKLVDDKTIFVRDMHSTADAVNFTSNSLPKVFSNKVKFVLSDKKLSVMVLPDDKNTDDSTKIDFGVDATLSGKDAIKNTTLKYGFLDNSHSPQHIKEWDNVSAYTDGTRYASADSPIDPTKKMFDVADADKVSGNISVFSNKSKWANGSSQGSIQNANWLRLYLTEGVKIQQQLTFAGKPGSDSFEGQNNVLTLDYQTGLLDAKPRDFVITATAAQAASNVSLADAKFYIYSDSAAIAPGDTRQYLKTDIALNKGIISFNAANNGDEEDYTLASPVAKVFFEDPYGQQTSAFASAQKTEIRTTPKTDVTNKNIELIADVLRNWNNYDVDPNSKTHIMTQTELQSLNGNQQISWPTGSSGFMNFDESIDTSDKMKQFVYQYQHFYVDSQQRIMSEPQKQFGLFKTNSEFEFELDSNGKPISMETNGSEIYRHFVEYTKSLTRWSINKLGLDDINYGIGKIDRYELTKPGESMGFVQTRLLNVAGFEGDELKGVADLLVRMWVGDALTPQEHDLQDKIDSELKGFLPDWINAITNKAKPATPGAAVDENSNAYKLSRQYIYAVIQPYFTKMLNKILEIETTKFDTNMKLSLKAGFEAFMNDTNNKVKVNDNLIQTVQTNMQDLANLHLVSLGSYGTTQAANGKESLKSLISFIYNAGLQNRFLKDSDLDTFKKYAENNAALLDDATLFEQDKQPEFVKLMQAISTIMDKTFTNGQTYVSFAQIVEKIQEHAYDRSTGNTPEDDLSNTIKYAIETIATDRKFEALSILGTSTDVTYLESLVMGKNIYEIFTQYQNSLTSASSQNDVKAIKEFLEQQKQYDMKSLTNLAVSLGNYNLDYFVKSLTESSRIEDTASEMLKQDLAKQIAIEIDSDNQLVNFLSNPDNLVKYAFIGIGAGAATIGGSIFGLSFRKSVRTSRKNLILERAVFIGIATLGIALALFGIIPGLL